MPIITTIARHYAWRCLLIAVGALVFGLWGVYDYAYKIPTRQRHVERGEVCRLVKAALEPGRPRERADEARAAVRAQIEAIRQEHFSDVDARMAALDTSSEEEMQALEAEFKSAIESIKQENMEDWLAALLLFQHALEQGEPTSPLADSQLVAYEIADQGAQRVANVTAPSGFDRQFQWAFIACLPFFPLYLWFFLDAKRRVYRLDGDGTLHLPEGVWVQDDIVDIDMSRWMAKSVAYVQHRDGRLAKLDDYKHWNLHLIVGAIASRLYPQQWDAEAKPVKSAADEESPAETSATLEV